MRLYGKRFMSNRSEKRINDRKESRDAVVYDVSEIYRYCRVRVAGTSQLVRAAFPTSFGRSPLWLKVGAAVRIVHVGGDKSRIEVVSIGRIQPTQQAVPMSGGVNTILMGMYPSAPIDSTGWIVEISSGSYRINGVSYSFNPVGALMGNDMPMGSGVLMGSGTSVQVIDPMENPVEGEDELWFRYDALVIGNDGVVDYLKGDEWMWEVGGSGPTKPSIPTDHVLIRNYILINSQTSAITQKNIGAEWVALYPHHLEVEYHYAAPAFETTDKYVRPALFGEEDGVIWGGPDVYAPASEGGPARGAVGADMDAYATVTVVDQFGNPFSWWSSGSINRLQFRSMGISMFGTPGGGSNEEGDSQYGEAYVGAWRVPPPEDLAPSIQPRGTGFGMPAVVSLGLGSSYAITYRRQSVLIAQPNPEADGYPGYYQGSTYSKTALYEVSLLSPDLRNPVRTVITFINVTASGGVM